MKLTILQVGETPKAMLDQYERYPTQFEEMFLATGEDFTFESVYVLDGEPFPDPAKIEGVIVTGSAAGVYEDHFWLDPLRDFIRRAYAEQTPMLGVCFGHQAMADALGGDVRKSEKGWGLGRHVYKITARPDFLTGAGDEFAIAASHQDQVIAPPGDAEVFLSSDFTPNAGLVYRNGAAISVQPHPELDVPYMRGLIELRRGKPATDDEVEAMHKTFDAPLDSAEMAKYLARFLMRAR